MQDWQLFYEAALHEQNPIKVADACEQARHAINTEFLLLAARSIARSSKMEELQQALRRLVVHEAETLGFAGTLRV